MPRSYWLLLPLLACASCSSSDARSAEQPGAFSLLPYWASRIAIQRVGDFMEVVGRGSHETSGKIALESAETDARQQLAESIMLSIQAETRHTLEGVFSLSTETDSAETVTTALSRMVTSAALGSFLGYKKQDEYLSQNKDGSHKAAVLVLVPCVTYEATMRQAIEDAQIGWIKDDALVFLAAQNAYQRKNIEGAIGYLDILTTRDSKNTRALLLMGRCYESIEKRERALHYFKLAADAGFGTGDGHQASTEVQRLRPRYLSPLRGGPTDVVSPDQIEIVETPKLGPVTQGATLQDAVNHVLTSSKATSLTSFVRDESGRYGLVTTGMAGYDPNVNDATALRLRKRAAHVSAYVKAQAKMAESLHGLSGDAQKSFISSEDRDHMDEFIQQGVEGLIRGCVVDRVVDSGGVIRVSVFTSPSTAAASKRTTTSIVSTSVLEDGIQSVLTEIQAGLCPLVGGRIVGCSTTGESALIGFGSAVVLPGDGNQGAASNFIKACTIAEMRAKASLTGLMFDENVEAVHRLTTIEKEVNSQCDALMKSGDTDADGRKRFRDAYATTLPELSLSVGTSSKGRLPPGIQTLIFESKGDSGDIEMVQSVAIYTPSHTTALMKTVKSMLEDDK